MNIHDSVVRVLSSRQIFGESFYDIFFLRCPQARAHFAGVEMKRQALVLTIALSVIEQHHSNPYAATEQYMKYLGTQHKDRAIPAELYPAWRDAMLESLQRFHGGEWSDDLAADWRLAIDRCIEVMFEGYSRHFSA